MNKGQTLSALQIAELRLRNLGLAQAPFTSPEDVLHRLVAVQAQEYEPAKWSLAQRIPHAGAAELERAVAEGSILRTHVLRPTWHFVLPEDIRWLLELTAPRVKAGSELRRQQLLLSAEDVARSQELIVTALQGGRQRTRKELDALLQDAGIDTNGQRIVYLLMYAELDALICSGAPRGKEQTYALLAERAPQARSLPKEEALARLTRSYFTTRGPATLADFRTWSSLSAVEANRGLELVRAGLAPLESGGRTYWHSAAAPEPEDGAPPAYLLQGFDEYLLYSQTKDIANQAGLPGATLSELGYFRHALVISTQVAARWRRVNKTKGIVIEFQLLRPLAAGEEAAVNAAVERYRAYVGEPVEWHVNTA
ncbi:MAG: winged helix DNA-binding domain-containing protein [Anaerolineae bacterium]